MKLRVANPLKILEVEWRGCQRCPLGAKAFRHVLYEQPKAGTVHVVLVGEGPGEAEDALGRPFVGPAGKKVLRPALARLTREFPKVRWALTNLVACRPRSEAGRNRPPGEEEILACEPRLAALLRIWRPRVLVALGDVAALNLPWTAQPPTFTVPHPASLLHRGWTEVLQSSWERKLWVPFHFAQEDLYGPDTRRLPADAWRHEADFSPRKKAVRR